MAGIIGSTTENYELQRAILADLECAITCGQGVEGKFPTLNTLQRMPRVEGVLAGSPDRTYSFQEAIAELLLAGAVKRHPTLSDCYMHGGFSYRAA